MKRIFTLSLLSFICLSSTAQNANLVVFSEMGEKFTLFLNGEAQNESPKANVKVNGLTGQFYQARIDFEDATLADFANNNLAVQTGTEATYLIKKNKKGEYTLRFNGEAPVVGSSSLSTNDTEDAKRISIVDKQAEGTNVSEANEADMENEPESGTVIVTQTSTTTTKNNETVNMNVNMNGVNMGINMTVDDEMISPTETTETTTVTTTSTNTKVKATETATAVSSVKCASPMSKSSFETAKTSINDKGFDETKLSSAKLIAKSNCLLSAQIKEIMGLFGFEETKLDFAKYAFDYCTDTNNYFMVSDAFSFSTSTEELNEYIDSKN